MAQRVAHDITSRTEGGSQLLSQVELLRFAAARIGDKAHRASMGQFFTPAPVTELMASMLACPGPAVHLLDAGLIDCLKETLRLCRMEPGTLELLRHRQLKNLFAGSRAGRVLVTAFLNRKAMLEYLRDIAWETEVGIADEPDHLIHFNGERFLGPYGSEDEE